MKNLVLNNPLNDEFKLVKDDDGTASGLSLAENKVKAENLEVRNLSGSINFDEELTIQTTENMYLSVPNSNSQMIFTGADAEDDAFQFKVANTSRFLSLQAEVENYSRMTMFGFGGYDSDDYLIIECGENGESLITTTDASGSDANLTIQPDGDLKLNPITGDTTFQSSVSNKPVLTIKNLNADALAGKIVFNKNGSSPGTNDDLGSIEFTGEDAGGNAQDYAIIKSSVPSQIEGQEGGKIELQVASHDGEMVTGLKIQDGSEEDEVDVIIGNGANSVTSIAGSISASGEDLTLASGTSNRPRLYISNSNADANGGTIHFHCLSASEADNDSLGKIQWAGNNDQAFPLEDVTVCRIDGQFLDVSDGAEKGRINLDVAEYDGTLTTGLTVFGTATNGQVDVTLGASATSTIGFSGKLQVPEISSPSAPSDGSGGYFYTKTDGKPYWISNEVSETDLSASGGGGGSATIVFGPFTARVGNISSSNAYMPGSYGLQYPFWSTNNALADRDHGNHDTNEYANSNRVVHIPWDCTLKGFTCTFYQSASSCTYLFEWWKATPSYPTDTASDLAFSDISINATSSNADPYKMKQVSKLDGSVSLSAGDVLIPYMSRASGTASGYLYISMSLIVEK